MSLYMWSQFSLSAVTWALVIKPTSLGLYDEALSLLGHLVGLSTHFLFVVQTASRAFNHHFLLWKKNTIAKNKQINNTTQQMIGDFMESQRKRATL